MEEKQIREISEVIQSSHLNFLIGAGASSPFLPILGDIEKKLNTAEDEIQALEAYKKYFSEVMLPNKGVVGEASFTTDESAKFEEIEKGYEKFFEIINKILLKRKTTILEKQANIFTTNIDVVMENTLEKLEIDYNDGFNGRLNPHFRLSNFKRSTHQRSVHFNHESEIPVINLLKMHGSLTWKYDEGKENILFSSKLDHFDDKLLSDADAKKAIKSYKDRILVVNPESAKLSETVLNTYYYELLRTYSNELDREGAVLFVIGFSMADQHIREITKRAAKSNPTLRIFIFSHEQKSVDVMEKLMETDIFKNIKVFGPEDDSKEKYTLKRVAEAVLELTVIHRKENEN